MRGHRRDVSGLAAFSAIEALPTLLAGQFIARALDHGFLAGNPQTGLAWLGALLAAMVVGAGGTRLLYPRLAALVEPVRDELVRAVVHASLYAPGHRSGGTDQAAISRLAGQVETVRLLLGALLRTARQFVLAVAATVGGTALLAPALVLVVGIPIAMSLFLFAVLLLRLARRQRAVVLADEAVADDATHVMRGIRDVRACQATKKVAATLGASIDAQAAASRQLARSGSIRVLVVALGVQVPILALILTGPSLVRQGHVTPGGLVAAATYLAVSLEPAVRAFVQVAGTWGLQLVVVLTRLAETTPPRAGTERPVATQPQGRTRGRSEGNTTWEGGLGIEIRDVTFAYGTHAAPVLGDLTLRIDRGEHLAVVGASGVGKSTLADLLAGLARPDRGHILIGGMPPPDAITGRARTVTLIPQEAYLFRGTLAENVCYLNDQLTPPMLDELTATLGLSTLLERHGGWDATLNPGDLAAGDRQLLALARAYASPAPVLILDEASCHLDPHREAQIENAFAVRGGTLVVIAHRISSAQRAHHVLLLDGAGTDHGTHHQLLDRSSSYRRLVGHWQPDGRTDGPASQTGTHATRRGVIARG